MKVYIVSRDGILNPFGDPKGDSLIGNVKLSDFMKKVFASLGLACIYVSSERGIDDSNEHIIIGDNVLCTEKLLREFIKRASEDMTCVSFALMEDDLFSIRTISSVQNFKSRKHGVLKYDLSFVPDIRFGRGEVSESLIFELNYHNEELSFPSHMCESGSYPIPITEELIAQIDHWTTLWSINVLVALSRVAELKNSLSKKLLCALRAQSLNQWKVLSKFNDVGMNCDIHPTAYVEASVIGNNVTIGAGAIVRGSIVGDGVIIDDGVQVIASVIGEGSRIYRGKIIFSVLYPESFSSTGLITTSLLGREVLVGSGALITDFRLDGKTVSVVTDGNVVDSKNRFIGACLGHKVSIGSGCIIAPGREIPNGTRLVPDRVISSAGDIENFSI